ncbi:hypothetical protein, partial [Staphylococcus agnetis]|uniref:hypothetical protein n=1 Tax=Staphylococcus agnetis TaxID=985762 RepID=UPI0039E9F550
MAEALSASGARSLALLRREAVAAFGWARGVEGAAFVAGAFEASSVGLAADAGVSAVWTGAGVAVFGAA